jgi:5-formyltetrahydrofolate cyclo-ligase
MDKPTLRRQWLAQRRSLTPIEWRRRSDQICDRLRQLPEYIQAQTVLAYSSYRQEPDLSPLWNDHSKVWGLPRCVDRDLVWHRFDRRGDTLQTGAFGILEPSATRPVLSASQVDLILVPCVGCDRRGYRLGYGGGFYDRLLVDPDWARIPTIGITFSPMVVDRLPVDPWDRPLAQVCTEFGAATVNHQWDGDPAP